MNYMRVYEDWCTQSCFDEKTKKELMSIIGQNDEIRDRFFKNLEFGTGGLRGVMGAGTNRMNIYTVRRATQGLAEYILDRVASNQCVVIAFDSRRMSAEFADESACCLCANGIKTFVFNKPTPTPMLSFAVRVLGCVAGIVITASHNPPEYNGYKIYWSDGAQITPPLDSEIIEAVGKVDGYDKAKHISKDAAIQRELYHVLSKEMDDMYINKVKTLSLYKPISSDVEIVYTPLHGTGGAPVQRILNEMGYENVWMVPDQAKPNGFFPTVSSPNPEEKESFSMALEMAERVNADLVLATDPDADRLGACVRDASRNMTLLNGNMLGALLCDYILGRRKEIGNLPPNGIVVSTIVSGKMGRAIARDYGVAFKETLTGFKYIGEQIKLFEEQGSHVFLFGYEESYGYLIGTHARDKDAVSASMLLCEAAAYYKDKGLSLWNRIYELYERYGHYHERLVTVTLKGADGAKKVSDIMERLRDTSLQALGGFDVRSLKDYASGIETRIDTKETLILTLPCSDVLYYELNDDAWCCIRPSGTEPKIKCYLGAKGDNETDAIKALDKLESAIKEIVIV